MNCPICDTVMTRGGVMMKNPFSPFGSTSNDAVYFEDIPPTHEREILRHGWVRDAFSCEMCEAVLLFDGRKTGPVS